MDGFVGLFLVCGVIYYLFGQRATEMVDVLHNRFQEYTKWNGEPSSTDPVTRGAEATTSRCTQGDLRCYGLQSLKRGVKIREQVKMGRLNSLYRIKEMEISLPDPRDEPSFLHYCCRHCTPSSRDLLLNNGAPKHKFDYTDLLVVPPRKSLLAKIFSHTSYVLNCKRYDYPRVTQAVLQDERLKEAIRQTAAETSTNEGCSENEALHQVEERAKSILLRMQSKISDTLLKITAWILYKLLPCFIQSAAIQTQQIEMLQKANDTGLPLIFLPLHRSHLDYIMISFLLLVNNIRNPLVAAGNNLRIPFFGWLMSGLGAFYIKRRIDPIFGRKDIIYRATLHTYIMECLRAGHNIEFFVEGGRSRTGKPCMPKGGILSVIIDAYLDGTIEDALLVPMSINYERLVDGNFVREQMGQPKKMETFSSAIRAMWATLMGNYGIVKVDVCEPFSLREMLKSFERLQYKAISFQDPSEKSLTATVSTSSLYGTDIVIEEHRQLVDGIARHIVYDCSKSTPIMSTNVVAFLLLNKFRKGCTLDNLVEAFEILWKDLESLGRDVAFCGETVDIVEHALEILGPGLVKQQRKEITDIVDGQAVKTRSIIAVQPLDIIPNVIELAYYSNTVLLHYVLDSVLVTALYSEVYNQLSDSDAIEANNITVLKTNLMEKALKVCDIFKYEFIFCKPCQNLEEEIDKSISNLIAAGILTTIEECYLEEELWSRRYAQTLEDSSDDESVSAYRIPDKTEYKLNLETSEKTKFLHTLLRPLIDTYTFSAFCLQKLVGRSLSERDLVYEILEEIKTNLNKGAESFGESLSVDSIKNSLKLFEKWDILECHSQENAKIYYLKDEYDDDYATKEVFEIIAGFKCTKVIE